MATRVGRTPKAGKRESLRDGKMSKVVVQHRSDMLMQEQISQVGQVQNAIQEVLGELSVSSSNTDIKTVDLREKMTQLQHQAEEKLLMLKIINKINVELVYARDELQRALKVGGNVNRARKRVGWLEDRMENLLGRKRVRSPARSHITEEAMPQTPLLPTNSTYTVKSDIQVASDLSAEVLPVTPSESQYSESNRGTRNKPKTSDDIPPNIGDGDAPTVPRDGIQSQNNLPAAKIQITIQPSDDTGDHNKEENSTEALSEDEESEVEDITKAASSEDALTLASEESDEEREEEKTNVTKRSKIDKGSRVTLKTPSEGDFQTALTEGGRSSAVSNYWKSEHHKFEYSEFKDSMLKMNPLSYHQMGLAVPGTFVESETYDAKLPWNSDTQSEITDVHKIALDKLAERLQKFHQKLSEAASLSTGLGPATSKSNLEDFSLKDKPPNQPQQPSMAKQIQLTRPASEQSVTFPPLMKERLGSSLSGRLIYYPNPLPYPENLPITRTTRSKVYPKSSHNYSRSIPGKTDPAERIVDQRNLYNETKFTSSLYRSNAALRPSKSASEKHFQKLLIQDSIASSSAATEGRKRGLRGTVNMVTGPLKFKGYNESEWSLMKPKTGAIEHSGLKWERVKSIVHDSLISHYLDERVDAAKHLGMLQCGDTLVIYALKERLKLDDDDRVRYEAAKSLISLGCWEEIVVEAMLFYLINGNTNMRTDILKTMINGKNVQYIDKSINAFPDLLEVLSILCESEDPEDDLALDAAVLTGKLCVHDDNATRYLRVVIKECKNTHIISEAVETLVRQMAYHEWDIVEAVLKQMISSPVWKHRLNAAKLLVFMGKRCIRNDVHQEYVYELLERRLWDDPNKAVRLEVAKAMAALDLFAQACERAEKRLEDSSEDVRAEAVITLGTLGMKAERILKTLLEMLDLDPSEYVRLMILRTIAQLNYQDKRIVRMLREKERGEGVLALEARKAMQVLGIKSLPSITSKVATNKHFTSAIAFSSMTAK